MSPEQARGRREIDHRSDLWSLGIVLYEMVAGRAPLGDCEGLGELIINICRKRAPPLDSFAPWADPALVRIVESALEIDATHRFQTAAELVAALEALLRASPTGGKDIAAIDSSMIVGIDPGLRVPTTEPVRSALSSSADPESLETVVEHRGPAITTGAASRVFHPRPLVAKLPAPITSFIGREEEIGDIRQLVQSARLVTLLGPGGTGKTRLALRVAMGLGDAFEHGTSFVDLSPLADPDAIARTAALALGVRGEPDQPIETALQNYLTARSVLMVLDNCEHLVAAAAAFAEEMLASCPGLVILATSREALAIDGETTYLVSPLPVPSGGAPASKPLIMKSDAVRLFIERARAVSPRFELSESNAGSVAQICRKLDGIPLAIELAAARVRVMTAVQIAERIDDRFRLLEGVKRTSQHRQGTLRALIDWSHDLLSEPERAVLRRLAVFQGGFSLAAAEDVCAWQGDSAGLASHDVGERVFQLVNKSLVIAADEGGEARYRMLETIRAYAADKLHASTDEARVVARHAEHFKRLAEEVEPSLRSADQIEVLQRLDAEHDNLRAALDACQSSAPLTETGLRIAGALGWFWWLRGHHAEGAARLERLLAPLEAETITGVPLGVRGKAFCQLGLLLPSILESHSAWEKGGAAYRSAGDDAGVAFSTIGALEWELSRGNREATLDLIREGLERARAASDAWLLARMLDELGRYHRNRLELEKANAVLEEGLSLARSTGDRWLTGHLLLSLALAKSFTGDYARATQLERECLVLQNALGFKRGMAETLSSLGGALMCLGLYDQGVACEKETLALAKSLGSDDLAAKAHMNIAEAELMRGDTEAAKRSLEMVFKMASRITRKDTIAWSILQLAVLCRRQGQPEETLRLFGAELAFEQAFHIGLHPHWRRTYDEEMEQARGEVGDGAQAAFDEGRALSWEQTLSEVLALLARP